MGGIDTLVSYRLLEAGRVSGAAAAKLRVVSPSYLARRVAEGMIQNSVKGRMVLSASVAIREPIPTLTLSSVCRIGIPGLVRTLARELGPKGIRVNGILPGYVKTERLDQVLAEKVKRRGINVKRR